MIEVVWLFVKVFGTLAILDTALYLILWRMRAHTKSITRRQKERQARTDKTRGDDFWSPQNQEELYRDFKRSA